MLASSSTLRVNIDVRLTQVNVSGHKSVAFLDVAALALELGVSSDTAVNARGFVVAT